MEVPTEEKSSSTEVKKDTIPNPITPPESPDTIPENPDSLSDGNLIEYVEYYGSTEETAYSVHEALFIVPKYLDLYDAIGYPDCYVSGFIVGFIPTNNISRTIFSSGDVATNIVLADSIGETDYHNCIPVQLTTSSKNRKATREALNLSAHPENIGTYVILHGEITKYMGTFGLKNVDHATIYTK
jgi:hypothetical protein